MIQFRCFKFPRWHSLFLSSALYVTGLLCIRMSLGVTCMSSFWWLEWSSRDCCDSNSGLFCSGCRSLKLLDCSDLNPRLFCWGCRSSRLFCWGCRSSRLFCWGCRSSRLPDCWLANSFASRSAISENQTSSSFSSRCWIWKIWYVESSVHSIRLHSFSSLSLSLSLFHAISAFFLFPTLSLALTCLCRLSLSFSFSLCLSLSFSFSLCFCLSLPLFGFFPWLFICVLKFFLSLYLSHTRIISS